MTTYIFIRETHFYFLELEDDFEARKNAEINPGTIRVETPFGRVVWESGEELQGITEKI